MQSILNSEFLFQKMFTGIVYQDKNGVIVNANPAAENLLGLTLDQMTGKTSVDPEWRSIKENGDPFPGDEHPAMVSLRTGEPVKDVQMGVYHPKKGQWVWILINSIPVLDENSSKPIGVYTSFDDITDKKKIEDELVKRNRELLEKSQNLEGLFNSQSTFIIKTDLNGVIVFANRAYIKFFGNIHDRPDAIGSYALDSIKPYHHEKLKEVVIKCLQNPGKEVQAELDKPDPKGGVKTVLWDFVTITNDKNEPIEILCSGIDITGLKESQKKLHLSEEKYRSLVEDSDNLIVTIDKAGKILYANAKTARMIGIEQSRFANENITIGMFYPEEDQRQSMRQDLDQLFEKGQGYTKVTPLKVGDNLIWVKGTVTPIFGDKGEVVSAHVSATDITERIKAETSVIESEAKYRSLVESSDAIIAMFDLEGVAIFANEVAEKFMGLKPGSAIENRFRLQDLFTDERKNKVLADIEKICQTKQGINEEVHLPIGNREMYFKSSLQPVFDQKEEVYAVLLNATDITEQKLNEFKLLESEANYRNLFYDSPHAYLIVQDGVFVDCNLASEALFGGTKKDLLGKTPAEISPERQLGGESSSELAKRLISRVEKETRISFEWTHRKKYGDTFLAEINLAMITYNGRDAILVDWKDITEERQNVIKVKQLSQIVDQSPVSILQTDLDGNIEYVNEALINSTGYSREELIGQNPRIWKSEQTPPALFKELWSTVLSGETWKGEFLNIRKNGSKFFESSTIFPIFDVKGNIASLVGIQEDISERKMVEAELKLFRTIFDSAVNGRLVTDLEGNIIYGNVFYAEMHECMPSALIGRNYIDYISETSYAKYKMMRNKLAQGQMIPSTEIEHKRKDGECFPALVTIGQLNDEHGGAKYLSVTVIDISERKQIENEIIELNYKLEEKVRERTKDLETAVERLETFFNQSLDMLCIAGQDGRFLKLSKAFEDVLHYKRAELEGVNYLDFVHPDDLEATVMAMQHLQEQKTVSQFINRYRTKEGEFRYIEWYSSPVGEYVYAVARDVTERMERERELINARKIAEEANASKSLFLSRMSHELRTPMNSILGFAQLLEMSELNEMQETSVSHILNSGKHLLGLINEVLDIARIETGKLTLSIEQVNMSAAIEKVSTLLEPQANKQKIKILLGGSLKNPVYVRADQQRVIQILTNVINNAIKYNKENGSIFIEQEESKDDKGNEMIKVSVRDTGIGIKEEDIPKLFTPFERIGAQNSEIEGTGLGLAVVKELIHVLNGEVGVYSEEGKGSTFWFALPKCTTDILNHTTEEIIEEQHIQTKESRALILYIEDNSMNISLVEDIFKLSRPGYDLLTTVYGGEALNLALEHQPKLILLDLDLPDIHGSEVLVQLRENESTKQIPVVVVSADATSAQVSKLMALGADKYLVKPFDIREFLETIDNYVK